MENAFIFVFGFKSCTNDFFPQLSAINNNGFCLWIWALSVSWFNLGISMLQALEMILCILFLRHTLLSPYPCKSFLVQIFLMYPAGQFLGQVLSPVRRGLGYETTTCVYATGKNKSILVNRETSSPLLSKQWL